MKNKYLLILISIFLFQSGMAQKQDFHWIFGINNPFYSECWKGTNWIDFNQGSLSLQCFLQNSEVIFRETGTATSISSPEGELLMASDGFRLFDRNLQLMENGDSLSPSDALNDHYEFGIINKNATIILPIPNSDNRFLLIHQAGDRSPLVPSSYYYVNNTYFSIVDLNQNGGMGKVVKKNKVLMSKNVQPGSLNAIRHANGRDWWIPIRHFIEPVYYVFLLNPGGIALHHTDTLDYEEDYYIKDMRIMNHGKQILYLGGEVLYWLYGQVLKSNFHIVNFDRCSGRLTNHKNHNVFLDHDPHRFAELSSDERFLYASNTHQLNQYDLHSENVAQSVDTLAMRKEDDANQMNFVQPRRTPTGEILVGSWSFNHITVVHNPELKGANSLTERFSIEIPQSHGGNFPNHPNFRIGPIDGSPCDTLGIDNEPKAWFQYNDMNLEPFERRFKDLSYFRPENWHWDFGDGTTFDGQHPGVHDFPGPGEYYVCLTVSNENAEDTYCRWVVIDEASNVDENLEEVGYALYPNPSTGSFTLELNQALLSPTDLNVYDLRGVLLRKIAMSAGERVIEVDLGGVPQGSYFLQWTNGSQSQTEKVIIIH